MKTVCTKQSARAREANLKTATCFSTSTQIRKHYGFIKSRSAFLRALGADGAANVASVISRAKAALNAHSFFQALDDGASTFARRPQNKKAAFEAAFH
ncbi:hypothetical protein CO659_06905 [Rhizobium sp. S9]|uniref:hypothetical protein n=1 Tax=unclassified Rhizobium TaxID=2613769 RepID=UPI000A2113E2|nr:MULTISPECIES: hypothetical protein [unclassified Rhizobium]ARO25933.1 hypothetical protein TAL182_CH04233 [Rhizobium sp. TAL182]PDS98426.1 hypothetical protein CO659_06905 [Rhizobium sp. S9]